MSDVSHMRSVMSHIHPHTFEAVASATPTHPFGQVRYVCILLRMFRWFAAVVFVALT